MASWKGFEPLTPGLGNRCSILLSYQDVGASLNVFCVWVKLDLEASGWIS